MTGLSVITSQTKILYTDTEASGALQNSRDKTTGFMP